MAGLDKFRKSQEKKGTPMGCAPIPEWISSGNMALNYIVSGNMRNFLPVGRSVFLSGPKGSGKSYLMGNIVKQAIDKGYTCIYIDTEGAIDENFMTRIGVDIEGDKFITLRVYSIEQATDVVSDIFKSFGEGEKVGIFVDSLSNLETDTEINKFDEGAIANTMGLVQRKYKAFVKGINNRLDGKNMFAIYTTHVYEAQDMYGPAFKVSGGTSIQFLPSIGVMLTSKPLKDGKALSGVTVNATTYKTRYQQVGLKTTIEVPWTTGMDLYDGVIPVFEELGILQRNGAWYSYPNKETGEVIKFQSKALSDHIDALIELYDDKAESYEKDDLEANLEVRE